MIRRLLAVFGLVLVGVAGAEAAPNLPDVPDPVAGRVAKNIQLWGPEELASFGGSTGGRFTGSTVSKVLSKGGKFIKYGGNFLMTASLLQDAMNWAHDNGRNIASEKLEEWWRGNTTVTPPISPPGIYTFPDVGDLNQAGPPTYCANGFWYTYYTNGKSHGVLSLRGSGPWVQSGYATPQFQGTRADFLNQMVGDCQPAPAPKLSDVLRNDPSAGRALLDTLADYTAQNPNSIRPYLNPSPNDNEFLDNPNADKTADTDKDGVPDYLEWEDYRRGGGGDPNDPAKKPLGAPHEVKRETTTRKNPDGSTTRRTVITYSDGSTAIEEVTTSTTTTKNPDGSTTTTTTTTTTRTSPTGEVTTRTTTRKETTPAPEPKPDPESDPKADEKRQQNECIAGGGLWTGGQCQPPADPATAEQNCKAQGGTWVGGSCSVGEKDRKEEKCLKAGRSWDRVNGTCGGNPEEEAKKEEEKKKKEEEEKKKQEDEKKNACEVVGRTWDGVNKTCGGESEEKKKADCKAKGGEWKEDEGKCGKKEEPVDDTCGEMSFKRLMAHPGGWFKDTVFPCDDVDFQQFKSLLDDKFPFSVISTINEPDTSGGGGQMSLPDHIGPFTVDLGFASGFFAFIKAAFRAVLWWFVINYLVARLSGQVVLS